MACPFCEPPPVGVLDRPSRLSAGSVRGGFDLFRMFGLSVGSAAIGVCGPSCRDESRDGKARAGEGRLIRPVASRNDRSGESGS
jgi:hypothetical protein